MRIDSRKNLGRFLLAAALFLAAGRVTADVQHTASVIPTGENLVVSIRVTGADVNDLFGSLTDGMRARIEFRIRIATPRQRPYRLFGDRLIREFRPAFEVRRNPFMEWYELEDSTGEVTHYENEAELFASFFSLDRYRIPWTALPRASQIVVETSVRYMPIVFVTGLSLLSLFPGNRSDDSRWIRHVVDRPEMSLP